jgi:uncharacterized membrane protein YgcG
MIPILLLGVAAVLAPQIVQGFRRTSTVRPPTVPLWASSAVRFIQPPQAFQVLTFARAANAQANRAQAPTRQRTAGTAGVSGGSSSSGGGTSSGGGAQGGYSGLAAGREYNRTTFGRYLW